MILILSFAVSKPVLHTKFRDNRFTGSQINARTGIAPFGEPMPDPRGASTAAVGGSSSR